jgi:aminopeptidase N
MRTTTRFTFLCVAALLTASCLTAPQPAPETPTASAPTPAGERPTDAPIDAPLPSATAITASYPATQASIGDPYYPEMGNGGYDALHYTLDLAANMGTNIITSTVTIAARATEDLSVFNLDFQGFNIGQIAVDDQPATYRRDAQELTITPATPLQGGAIFTTTVAYAGTPQTTTSPAVRIAQGWNAYPGGVFIMGEPGGASTWYPVNNHPRDKATYTIRVTVAKPYVAAANGLLQSTVDNGATRTYLWQNDYPTASYLVALNIAPFVVETAVGPGGLPIRNFFPADVALRASRVFSQTDEMIAFFAERFGPYPFDAYGVAVANQTLGFALESQTLSLFDRRIAGADDPAAAQSVIAHELAHQWFGDSVTLMNWQDLWLNEGFATYAAWLWQEHAEGAPARDTSIREAYGFVASERPTPPALPPSNNLFNAGVYVRGGLTLHALRLHVGDDTFFDILRAYAKRYAYGNASTDDFVALAGEISGQDLSDFFYAWLYADDIPAIPEMSLSPQ